MLYRPLSNYAYGDLNTVGEMMKHPDTLVSLGDGGAHVGVLCDASSMAIDEASQSTPTCAPPSPRLTNVSGCFIISPTVFRSP